MKNSIQNKASGGHFSSHGLVRTRLKRGFTMFEVLLVVVALGLLAALVIPTVDRFIDATGDTAKTHNAEMLNQYMQLLYNAGADMSTYTTGTATITALEAGVTIAPAVPGSQAQVVKLNQTVNADAYDFTVGDGTTPPRFVAKLGVRSQRP